MAGSVEMAHLVRSAVNLRRCNTRPLGLSLQRGGEVGRLSTAVVRRAHCHPKTAFQLLSAGASPDIKNEEMGGATPLMLATLQGDEDMAKIISRYSGSRGEDTMLSAEGRPMTARAM